MREQGDSGRGGGTRTECCSPARSPGGGGRQRPPVQGRQHARADVLTLGSLHPWEDGGGRRDRAALSELEDVLLVWAELRQLQSTALPAAAPVGREDTRSHSPPQRRLFPASATLLGFWHGPVELTPRAGTSPGIRTVQEANGQQAVPSPARRPGRLTQGWEKGGCGRLKGHSSCTALVRKERVPGGLPCTDRLWSQKVPDRLGG